MGSHRSPSVRSPFRACRVILLDMDNPAMPSSPATTPAPCPVADTMRRVQDQLRAGQAPSFEAMLAYGEPTLR